MNIYKNPPVAAYFIRLGAGNVMGRYCIEQNNTLHLNYDQIPHDLCQQGDWKKVHRDILGKGIRDTKGAATRDVNQLKFFYKKGEEVLWITFYQERLYWCRASQPVIANKDGTRERQVIGAWQDSDEQGRLLWQEQLPESIQRVGKFRGTICRIQAFDDLMVVLAGRK